MLMSDSLGASLPEELLEAILVRLDRSGLDIYYDPGKLGLASCSQTCRRWATFIRPLLWRNITLRTREDEQMFSELLDAPNFLAPSIRDCLLRVKRNHDGPVSSIPPFMSLPVIPAISSQCIIVEINWVMRGDTSRTSPLALPSASLPRILPRSLLYLKNLHMHGIHGLSIRDFLRFVRCTRISTLTLRDVEFADESELDTIRRLPAPRSFQDGDLVVQLCKCIPQASSLPFWIALGGHVRGCQRTSARASEASALALQSLTRALDMQPDQHEPLSLVIRSGSQSIEEHFFVKVENPPMELYWQYHFGGENLLAEFRLSCPEDTGVLSGSCKYQFPAMHGSFLVSAVSHFWDELVRADDTPSHHVIIGTDTEQAFRDLLLSILEGRLFTHGPVHLVHVEVMHYVEYSMKQILSTPTTVVSEHGTERTLTAEERVEHLMSPPDMDSVRMRLEELAESAGD